MSHSTSHFCIGYFWNTVSLYAQAGMDHNLFMLPHVAGITGMYCHAQTLIEMGSLRHYLSWLAWTSHPPDLCFPSIGVSYCIQSCLIFETGPCYIAQAGLKFEIFPSQPPEYWEYKCVPLCPVMCFFLSW
jgi:hypothetical protein